MPLQTSSSTSNDGLGHVGVARQPATAAGLPATWSVATRRAAAAKLAAARARLILDKPFLGALVLRLPLVEAGHWCKTTGTDARKLYYNPQWVDALSSAQTQFALAHEALHCALGHFARRGRRVQRIWDLACDFAINPLLLDEGLQPPLGAQVLDLYRGMAAEEIYPCISDTLDSEQFDDHVWDGDDGGQAGGGNGEAQDQGQGGGAQPPGPSAQAGGQPQAAEPQADPQSGSASPSPVDPPDSPGDRQDGPPAPLSAQQKEQLQQQWQRFMAAAAQRAREAGKLSGGCPVCCRKRWHLRCRGVRRWRTTCCRWRVTITAGSVPRGAAMAPQASRFFPGCAATAVTFMWLWTPQARLTTPLWRSLPGNSMPSKAPCRYA